MVEVCNSNFQEIFPVVKTEIANASFIAIDTEFTGLLSASHNKSSLFDSTESHYLKLRNAASSFIISQLGLSMYTHCKFKNVYTVQTYNFYIRPYSIGSVDKRFLCQASSIDFLCKYKFDFNKFLMQGIPYLNEVEEEQVRKELHNGTAHINQFRNQDSDLKMHDMLLAPWLLKAKEGDELVLESYVGLDEYFQLCELRLKYPSIWAISTNGKEVKISAFQENDFFPNDARKCLSVIIVMKVSIVERQKLEKSVKEEEERLLKFYIGFSEIFKALIEAKKPLVGHNMFTDILLIYGSFYRPLPETYSEFKQSIHGLFPVIYDTKHIWLNMKSFYEIDRISKNSSLLDLYMLLKRPPDHMLTVYNPTICLMNCKIYESLNYPHNAGFDSFATGYVFVKICHLLGMSKCKSSSLVQPLTYKEHLAYVKPFENKLNVMRSKLHYIDLDGKDPTSHRPKWLLITAKHNNVLDNPKVIQELSRFGYVELKLLSKKKGLVAASNEYCAKQILKAFRNHENLVVCPYSLLRHSTPLRATLWVACLLSGSLSVVFLVKLVKGFS